MEELKDLNLKAYPTVYYEDHRDNRNPDKIILHQSILEKLNRMDVDTPYTFIIENKKNNKSIIAGVYQFHDVAENIVFMPPLIFDNLLLYNHENADITITVKNNILKKGTYIKLKPQTRNFLDIIDYKTVLEQNIMNYTTLQCGQTIRIFNNEKYYDIDIVDTKPDDRILVINTDIEVDFEPPDGYLEELEAMKKFKPLNPNKANGNGFNFGYKK